MGIHLREGDNATAILKAARSEEVLHAAAAALDSTEIALVSSDIFCKPPQQQEHFVGWHQDQSWWRVEPANGLTNVWIALDNSGLDSACVRYLPGSHLPPAVQPHEARIPGNQLLYSINVSATDAQRAVCARLHPGEFIVFSGLAIHSSPPNLGLQRRCGMVLRFAPASA